MMNAFMNNPTIISPAEQRKLFCTLPTGVTAITGFTEQDKPIGMVVGTFQSLSLEPALVTFCVDKSSSTWPVLRSKGHFTANILSTDQASVCKALGRKGEDKFKDVAYSLSPIATPRIDHCVAWIDCKVISEVIAGDHFMIVGAIQSVQQGAGSPLVFSEGQLSQCSALPSLVAASDASNAQPDPLKFVDVITDAWTRAWSYGETEAFENIVSPDYVRYSKHGQNYKIADVIGHIQEVRAAFSQYRVEILKTVDDGDSIAIHWRAIAKHTGSYMGVPPTQKEMIVNGASFIRHRNGKIVREWMMWDPSEFLSSIDIWHLGSTA